VTQLIFHRTSDSQCSDITPSSAVDTLARQHKSWEGAEDFRDASRRALNLLYAQAPETHSASISDFICFRERTIPRPLSAPADHVGASCAYVCSVKKAYGSAEIGVD